MARGGVCVWRMACLFQKSEKNGCKEASLIKFQSFEILRFFSLKTGWNFRQLNFFTQQNLENISNFSKIWNIRIFNSSKNFVLEIFKIEYVNRSSEIFSVNHPTSLNFRCKSPRCLNLSRCLFDTQVIY